MRVLDLFSGIGGFSLGLKRAGMSTQAFCEIDPYCQAVLRKNFPGIPIHEDVRLLDGAKFKGSVELICGGYPCQPFSTAGQRGGDEDERHLWPEMLRIIQGCRPRYIIAENVAGHISLGFDSVASSLETEGFTVWPFVIPACAVDAKHRRDRVWIVAHAKGERELRESRNIREENGRPGGALPRKPDISSHVANAGHERILQRGIVGDDLKNGKGSKRIFSDDPSSIEKKKTEDMAYAIGIGCERSGKHKQSSNTEKDRKGKANQSIDGRIGREWLPEPGMGRVAHGIPNRVDRLRGLGNAIVPQIAEIIGEAILAYDRS